MRALSVTTGLHMWKTVSGALGLLFVLSFSHFLMDTVACATTPLWPDLERHYSLPDNGGIWLFFLWTSTANFGQVVFGYLGDRFHGRWMIWSGLALAVVCVSTIGLTTSPVIAIGLLALGAFGVAAFHPEAAAIAGACAPAYRSRAVSIFSMGGYLGAATGPYYGGVITDNVQLSGLSWTLVWGLIGLVFVVAGLRNVGRKVIVPHQVSTSIRRILTGRRTAIGAMVLIGTLRVFSAAGVLLALSYLLKENGMSNSEIGCAQSIFMACIGLGSIACALLMRRQWERFTLIIFPLCAAPVLGLIGACSGLLMLLFIGASGLTTGVAFPVLISYGQQLLPESQRVANSLTMGVSWGLGSAFSCAVVAIFDRLHALEMVFSVFAFASILSSLLGLALLDLSRDISESD